MGMFDFRRYDGFVGSIPQHFIDAKLPKCPMCGTTRPNWTLKDKMEIMGNRTMFRCDSCQCILSATTADLSGMNRTVLTTTGLLKAMSGKKNSSVYLRVEEVGSAQVTRIHQGKEMPVEELQALANGIT